ncbi:MAG: hypothetical protein H6739_39930 [Alphaproteobacteria bacterium]|nr:hypothetical protein [Alphaproteobacteria bacterium]
MSADPQTTRDVDALTRRLLSPLPELAPPLWPEEEASGFERLRAWVWPRHAWVLVPALAALMLVVARPWGQAPDDSIRGVNPAAPVWVSLDLLVQQDGAVERLGEVDTIHVGDRVFFRVAAGAQVPVSVWVRGPAGVEPITTAQVGPTTTDLRSARGLYAYRFDQPGRYIFMASPAPEVCTPPACAEQTVEVP